MTSQIAQMTFLSSHRNAGHTLLTASIFFGVSAHLLLKFGMLAIRAQPHVWLSYFWVFSGLAIYASGTAFWMLCLRTLNLSYAYPLTAISYVLVLGASWLLFDDHVSFQRIAGVLVICLGVALIPTESEGKS